MSDSSEQMLPCQDCGKQFPWTEREQVFFRERDFPPPKRCKECRQANQQRFGGRQADGSQRDGSGTDERA